MYTSKLGISDGIHILVLACQRVGTFLCILVAKFIGAELNRSGVQLFRDNPFFLFGIAAVVRFLSSSYSHFT